MATRVGTTGKGPVQRAPANTVAPSISGTPTVGQTLSLDVGDWSGHPGPSLTQQWYWGDTSAPISGATGDTYTLVVADAGHTIRCTVTATNRIGSDSADTDATAAVAE